MTTFVFSCSCGAHWRVLRQGPTEIGDGSLLSALAGIRRLHESMGHLEVSAQEAQAVRRAAE